MKRFVDWLPWAQQGTVGTFLARLSLVVSLVLLCGCDQSDSGPNPDVVGTRVAAALAVASTLTAEAPPASKTPTFFSIEAAVAATLTALAPTPSSSPVAVNTIPLPSSSVPHEAMSASPTPTRGKCDATFVADLTIPDGTRLEPGVEFVKTWRLRNVGTPPWTEGFCLAHVSGERMSAPASIYVPETKPGEMADISVSMKAPSATGSYRSDWQLRDEQGRPFGPGISVKVTIRSLSTPVPTQVSSPAPAAMVVDNWEIEFERVQTADSLTSRGGMRIKAAGRFALLFLSVTNRGLRPDTFVGFGTVAVQDAQGRKFQDDHVASTIAMFNYNTDIGARLNPDDTAHVVVAYDVSADSASYHLVPGTLARQHSGSISFHIP